MTNKYKDMMNKVEPSDEVKEKVIANMQASFTEETQTKRNVPRRKALAILTSAVCMVCICCVLFLMLNPAFRGGQNTQYYRTDSVFTHEAGGTAVFKSVELKELEGYTGWYLIFNGVFDFNEFTLSRSGAEAKCVRQDIEDEIELEFKPDITQALSEANLHIESDYAKTNGTVNFVFGLNNEDAEKLISYLNTDTPSDKWDLELKIESLASKKETPLFVFNLKQINF